MISASIAANSFQHQHRSHRPLNILNRDDDDIVRFKSHIIAKRKSAVELLQETKPLYVKSEIVLDKKQELSRSLRGCCRCSSEDGDISSTICADSISSCRLSCNISSLPSCHCADRSSHSSTHNIGTVVSSSLSKSPRLIPPPPAFRKSTNSLELQNKLRELLNGDSKENLSETSSVTEDGDNSSTIKTTKNNGDSTPFFANIHSVCHKSLPDLTNVRDLTSSVVSVSSDGMCKKSNHADCISMASCKNDYLYASADCCGSQNDFTSEEDEADLDGQQENSSPLSPIKPCSGYITPPLLYCDGCESRKTSLVSNNKSDVGTRILSSLQFTEIPLYDASNLNMFFDNLGLESNEYNSLTAPRSNASSPTYFDSDSSVISTGECVSDGDSTSNNHTAELPSIVERNARIIKWLCNCRKALEQIPRFVASQSR